MWCSKKVLSGNDGFVRTIDGGWGRARTILGYQPKFDLRQGLAAYIEWYRRGRPEMKI
jgi:nucleoside-diphosphate-sugar epimerase